MLYSVLLFAQEEGGKGQGGQDGLGGLGMILPMILILLAFFFLIVMPA